MIRSLGRSKSPKKRHNLFLNNYATVRSNSYCSMLNEIDRNVLKQESVHPSIQAWTSKHSDTPHYQSFVDLTTTEFPYYNTGCSRQQPTHDFENLTTFEDPEIMTTRSMNPYQSPPSFYYSHLALPQTWNSPTLKNGSSPPGPYQNGSPSPGYYPVHHIATLGRSKTDLGRADHRRLNTPPSFVQSSSKLYEKRKSSPFSTSTLRRQSLSTSNYANISANTTLSRGSSMVYSGLDSEAGPVLPRRAQQVMNAYRNAMQSRLQYISKKAELFHGELQGEGITEERSGEINTLLLELDGEAKRYTLLETTIADLQEQYTTQIKLFEEAQKFSNSDSTPGRGRKLSPTPSFKGGIKQIAQNLNYIENEIEKLMGTLHVDLKGIQGFARIAPGDVYEVILRHGQQKWKSRGKARADRTQKWDQQNITLKCLMHEPLEIKASEVKLFGKTNSLGEQSCDLTRLFSAEPQLMTVNLNLNGSLKLHLVITWKPAEPTLSNDGSNGHWSFSANKSLTSKSPRFARKLEANKNGQAHTLAGAHIHENNVTNLNNKTMPSAVGQAGVSPRLIRSRPDRRIPLEFLENGTTVDPGNAYKPPPLLSVLRALKPLIQKLLLSYPDLTGLHDVFFKLDALLKRSLLPTSVRSPRSNRKTLDLGSGLHALQLDNDGDNLDDNFFTRSEKSETLRTHDSGFDSLRMGRTPQPDYIEPIVNGSPNNKLDMYSPKSAVVRDKRKSWGVGMENSPSMEQTSWATPQTPTTGNPQIDTCMYHHLRYCQVLLKNLEQLYGPLRHRRREIRMKLSEETSTLHRLLHMTKNRTILPNINTLLLELDASHELQDIWLSVVGSSEHILHVPQAKIRELLATKYSHIVKSRYPDLVKQVLDKLDFWLSDRYAYSTDVVTVFQFITCFRDKQMNTFVESLAHETWINASLQTKVGASVQQVMDRLSKVPIAPPQLCLAQIGILLAEHPQINLSIDEYLKRSTHALRTDLIAGFIILLESDDPQARKGACKALGVLKAIDSEEYLNHVARCDTKKSVRDEASKSLAHIRPNASAHNNHNGVHKIQINDDENNEDEHTHCHKQTTLLSTKF